MIVDGRALSELRVSIENAVQSPDFIGDADLLLVEGIQVTLDAPLILVYEGERVLSNALAIEYEFIESRETRRKLSEIELMDLGSPAIEKCIVRKEALEPLTYDLDDAKGVPLRSRFAGLRGALSFEFEYAAGMKGTSRIELYLEAEQFDRLDRANDYYVNTQELASCLSDCLTEIYDYKVVSICRREIVASRLTTSPKYEPEYFSDILSETKHIVERLLPSIHKGFRMWLKIGCLFSSLLREERAMVSILFGTFQLMIKS